MIWHHHPDPQIVTDLIVMTMPSIVGEPGAIGILIGHGRVDARFGRSNKGALARRKTERFFVYSFVIKSQTYYLHIESAARASCMPAHNHPQAIGPMYHP